jgi:hypothetical protein
LNLPTPPYLARTSRKVKETEGYAIFVHALAEGVVPLVRDENSHPVVFSTEREAQLEIADNLITRLREFIDGNREFEDALSLEEFVMRVDRQPDGSLFDESGARYL